MSKVIEKLFEIQALDLTLTKDSENKHFGNSYASLGAVLDLIKPALTERGLLMVQSPGIVESGPALFTTICAADDPQDSVESVTPLILDKTTMQGMGSAVTYARRYALVSMFNLDAEDDDDGNAASGTPATPARRTTTPRRGR